MLTYLNIIDLGWTHVTQEAIGSLRGHGENFDIDWNGGEKEKEMN